jgi:hypothetical protein
LNSVRLPHVNGMPHLGEGAPCHGMIARSRSNEGVWP